MTNVNRKFFDELADVLKAANPGNALILQIADVIDRNCTTFKPDEFTRAAGYAHPKPLQPPGQAGGLRLGSTMRVVPLHPSPENMRSSTPDLIGGQENNGCPHCGERHPPDGMCVR